MKPLNVRQERFAQLVASGMAASRAYQNAGYKSTGNAAESSAVQLLRNPKVVAYVDDLKNRAKRKNENAVFLTIEEKRTFLREVVTTPVGQVDASSRLAQAVKVTKDGKEIRVPDKLRALELDAKLAGELKDKVEHSASPELAEWLALRRGGVA
jgi:phage terminase small subunit